MTIARRGKVVAARPSTPAQCRRYDRILSVATEMLLEGGENALQMLELRDRADVSLTALYRYFPSKNHVLVAVAADRYESAFLRRGGRRYPGATPSERVAYFLRRSFALEYQEPELAAAMHTIMASSDPEIAPMVTYLFDMINEHLEISAGPFEKHQSMLIPVVFQVAGGATRDCLAGRVDPEHAVFVINLGARLLDVPPKQIQKDRDAARTWSNPSSRPGRL